MSNCFFSTSFTIMNVQGKNTNTLVSGFLSTGHANCSHQSHWRPLICHIQLTLFTPYLPRLPWIIGLCHPFENTLFSVLPSDFSSKPLDCLFSVSDWRVFLLLPLKCWCSQCPVLPLHSSPPLYSGDVFQDPLWMPEIADSAEPYTSIYYIFSYTYKPIIKLIYRLVTVWD